MAHKLTEKASNLFENFYKCTRQAALSDPHKAVDGTYYKILVPEKDSKGKGVRKEYPWVVADINARMIYLLYDDDSRSERVILNGLGSCKGIIQSDGCSSYQELENDAYPNITRIPCLQYTKQKFIDCGEKDPDARRIVELVNAPHRNRHKHKVGVEGWAVGQNLMHRKKYALDVLGKIEDVPDEVEERGDLLPKSELQEAIAYLHNEWNTVVDAFNYGNTYLGNNAVERISRYISLSKKTRRSSAIIRGSSEAPYSIRQHSLAGYIK